MSPMPVWGYVVFPASKGAGYNKTMFHWGDEPEKAAELAKRLARQELEPYYVAKMVLTHYVREPEVSEPEVQPYADAK